MKVRIGINFGAATTPAGLGQVTDLLENAGIDSLWLSEIVYGSQVEPFIGMAHVLARTSRLKVGTGVSVLPGRHPVLVAKQLTSLAALAPGRVLPVFGLQPARPAEAVAFPVAGKRGEVFDEALDLLRRLVTQENVTFAGKYFHVADASVGPLPAKPLDIWLGGSAPAGLRRIGRFGDGWLGSLLTPEEAGVAREQILAAAAEAGRQIDDDHYGISLAIGPVTPEAAANVARRRPGADPATLAPADWAAARRMIEGYVEAGLSKFVIRPAVPAADGGIERFIGEFTEQVLPLET